MRAKIGTKANESMLGQLPLQWVLQMTRIRRSENVDCVCAERRGQMNQKGTREQKYEEKERTGKERKGRLGYSVCTCRMESGLCRRCI